MITPAALLVVLSRLGAAVLAGGLLGLNRELRGKSVGLRICSLVTLGAAMATLVMVRLSSGTAIAAGAAAAPDGAAMSRIVQGVLTGVGFLGAGVILRDSGGHVTGLTTAATIWVSAVLGVFWGMGDWPVALGSTALVLLVLNFGGAIERFTDRLAHREPPPPPD